MSIRVSPCAKLSIEDRQKLEQRLCAYYSDPPPSYYTEADRAADQYTPALQPFHCDLINHVEPGFSVVEIGCGSAHLCPHIEAAGGFYTGVDHSEELLEQNRIRFPKARFFSLKTELRETFDLVASLYTIEHVAEPERYLERLWNFSRAGGLIALICPDFIDGDGFPPSFYYGKSPRRFRAKISSFALIDAITHLLDLSWFAPQWKKKARAFAPGAFWINLAPRIFAGAPYSIDADAVHLPRLQDLVWWFQKRPSMIVETSLSLVIPDKTVLKHNCYVLARKTVNGAL